MSEDIFGQRGIDTSYERNQVNYRPDLKMPKKDRFFRINPATVQKIIRSEDFTITSVLKGYSELVERMNVLMKMIEDRNQTPSFFEYKGILESGDQSRIIEQEDILCGPRASGDAEIYTILYRMKASCSMQFEFVDGHYRTQITGNAEVSAVEESEANMINQWIEAEQVFNRLTDEIQSAYSDEENHEEDITNSTISSLERQIYDQDLTRQQMEALHVSLSDTSYVHRNRYAMYSQLLDQMQFLITNPAVVMKDDLKGMILQVAPLADKSSVAAYVLLSFRNIKDKLTSLKGQYALIDDQKESFVSKQQWFYQQLESKSGVGVKNWLYNQSDTNESMNALAEIIVGSLSQSKNQYDSSITDMTRFYQQEAIFYSQQYQLIQKKEEIRRFLRILEDLQEASNIDEEWAISYLETNGYAV
ncbi:hypothetical protein PUW25_25395 (plasmid) [Paenibacillus urinalis]|uniref:Uncharacterized protein n=1 Tax=Paenibacillus urinalis TaxID=521520 RepID=A0ABY7XH61_9BACL|nr:hypothetical protein [Paenibacillus urinalis]WDI05146.1 hypothetical protein PUW25_25395 [Paenibacillus urinalis]